MRCQKDWDAIRHLDDEGCAGEGRGEGIAVPDV